VFKPASHLKLLSTACSLMVGSHRIVYNPQVTRLIWALFQLETSVTQTDNTQNP